ncbi:pilus (MSHA type) biogenesis protein MshL [Wolinella succinogenes]|uniref:PUTATIVE TYPE II SECRETION SYSTEM D n=1 Tax=Wolinella succinogenes (strain ATCC 29543 / DSM 1740 / CCUG 13145 / JCM 31913 / LMG 7466 / NCTC 11488 / FDC 602W) TaxID=273121 RepID=Q7MA10_WOLSU|nr:pilus (MSHA type) biogenesis protein MshL [Wolinella succinogenes]CAE09676.1 PUTATIVE TYPE II SECRETION SYSTEM D [Wolinella succinogenes]VEG81891.1 Type IV pilus biogenesis and competence protein pilQ precursor [Wolinella succinogenes]
MRKGWIFFWVWMGLALSLQAASCKDRVFNLSTQDSGVSVEEVVKQLASECAYSILLKDEEARARLKADMPALNIRQAPLERVFDLVLKENGLYYEFDGSVLKISYLVTKTFKINYVGMDRSGVSNTEVSISRDDGINSSSSSSSALGSSQGSSGSSFQRSSVSGSKSGINIKAEDGFRFWEGIQAEILAILNRPGDSYTLPQANSILLKDEEARARLKADMPALNIRQAPLERVFDLVLKENGLYYEFDGSVLKISYLVTKTFKINYVGMDRSGVSNTEVSISRDDGINSSSSSSSALGSSQGSSGSSFQRSSVSGSKSGINIKAEDGFRFWEGIQAEILAILNRPGDSYTLPQANSENRESEILGGSLESSQAQQARTTKSESGAVIVNRGAGLVTVTGTSPQVDRVAQYIEELHARLQSQVMIDVSILTVRHSKGQTTGVDWNQLYNLQNIAIHTKSTTTSNSSGSGSTSDTTSITTGPSGTSIQQGTASGASVLGVGSHSQVGYAVNIFSQGVSLTRVIEFLQSYGDVTSVSNPKVLTLNNQPAMISVGNIIRYRKSTVFQTSGSNTGTNTNTDTEYPSVFAGVLLDITPSVFNDEIMLKINPSITQTKSTDVENASTALETPPNLSTNQLSSLVRIKDGEKIVLGGLISKSNQKKENKVPLLGDVPVLGYLFSYNADVESTDEMVIVITPHIIKGSQGPSLQELGYRLMGEKDFSGEKIPAKEKNLE